ncbi:acyltransferase [Flammeovirga pectinis]|nr:acyltransferase [Flammeovirga pectinis]
MFLKEEKQKFIGIGSIIVSREYISIGKGTHVAEYTVIRDQDHLISDLNKFHTKPIIIKENVWICNKVSILKGTTINSNSILGAHAVVNKDIPANSLAVGIPVEIK